MEVIHQVMPGPVEIDGARVAFFKGSHTVYRADGLTGLLFKDGKAFPDGTEVYLEVRALPGGKPCGSPICRTGQFALQFQLFEVVLKIRLPVGPIVQG